jgi:hypothetical protein
MNPAPISSSTPEASLQELRQSVDSLRGLLNAALLLVIILATGLNIFLYRQVTLGRRQVADTNETLTNYEKNMRPTVVKFLTQIQAFAKANPDFAPILAKHFPSSPIAVPPPPPK